MRRRWLAACVVAIVVTVGLSLAISLGTRHAPTVTIRPSGHVVLIGVPELAWTDTTARKHPDIYARARTGAVGGVLVRNILAHSCSKNSWLTVSAVARTGVLPGVGETKPGEQPGTCPPVPQPVVGIGDAYFPQWPQWRRATQAVNPHVDLGLLGSTFAESDECITAVGRGAAIGAADRHGHVANYEADPERVDFAACAVTIVSLNAPTAHDLPDLLERIPQGTTVVIAGLADDTSPEHLRAAVVTGPGIPHGRLTSLNTRQPGLVTTADLAKLLLSRVTQHQPPTSAARQPLVLPSADPTGPVTSVTALGRQLAVEYSVTQTFFLRSLTIASLVLALGAIAALGYRRWAHARGMRARGSPAARAGGMWVAGAVSAIPVSTFLIGLLPWWNAPHPGLALTAGVLAIAVTISAVAYAGPWRRWRAGPMCVVLGITAYTVAVDVVHGSRLQLTSMMGLQPIYGGRFYGIGNVGFAMMGTAALVVAAVLAGHLRSHRHQGLALATVLLIGIPTIIVDGYPEWGADGGGPAALLPAFAYLAMNAGGLKVTWQRVVVIAGSTAAVIALVGFADYLRPPRYRTHLGDFVADIVQRGQWGGLGQIVDGNWKMLNSAWYMMITPIVLIIVIAVLVAPPTPWLRPVQRLWEVVPFLGHGLAAAVICWTLGFLANDSGTAIPPIGLFVLAPLLLSLGIRTLPRT